MFRDYVSFRLSGRVNYEQNEQASLGDGNRTTAIGPEDSMDSQLMSALDAIRARGARVCRSA